MPFTVALSIPAGAWARSEKIDQEYFLARNVGDYARRGKTKFVQDKFGFREQSFPWAAALTSKPRFE